MFGFFNYKVLGAMAEERRSHYQMAYPFPHEVVDAAAEEKPLGLVEAAFPKKGDVQWWSYDNALERKLAFDKVHELPVPIKLILCEMNSAPFVNFLEKLTGINGLIPDPHYAGGGLHNIERNGKLDVHADFDVHTRMWLRRRLNVILYLNKDWNREWNGQLELWDADMKAKQVEIFPDFNRMVVFNTDDTSYHGHPEILKCPEDVTRKSIALYYYTSDLSEKRRRNHHSTLYQKRPGDLEDPQTEELRQRRAHGRIEDRKT